MDYFLKERIEVAEITGKLLCKLLKEFEIICALALCASVMQYQRMMNPKISHLNKESKQQRGLLFFYS